MHSVKVNWNWDSDGEWITDLVLLLGRLVVLVALGDDALLLLHGRDVAVDDGVELFTHVVLDVHLMVDDFVGYCLLDSRCWSFQRVFRVSDEEWRQTKEKSSIIKELLERKSVCRVKEIVYRLRFTHYS